MCVCVCVSGSCVYVSVCTWTCLPDFECSKVPDPFRHFLVFRSITKKNVSRLNSPLRSNCLVRDFPFAVALRAGETKRREFDFLFQNNWKRLERHFPSVFSRSSTKLENNRIVFSLKFEIQTSKCSKFNPCPRGFPRWSRKFENPGKILPTRHFYFRSPEQRNVCRCNLLTRVQCDESLGERLKFRGGIQSTRDVSNVSVFEILLELLCRRSDKWNRIFTRSSSLLPRNATRKINQRQGSVSKCCVLRVRRQRVENDSSACRCCASRTHAWPMAFNLEISSKFVSLVAQTIFAKSNVLRAPFAKIWQEIIHTPPT